MEKALEKLRKKKADLLLKKQALAAEQAKLKSKISETKTKKRNGQIHVLGLYLDRFLRSAKNIDDWEKTGMEFFTRDVDKKRFKEAINLIKKGLPLGTLEEIPVNYEESSES